jgi:hypothetical protein
MKARRLISDAAYGPDELRVLFEVFDQAWEAIAAGVGENPAAVEAARLKLANHILSLARGSNLDQPEQLKAAALQLMSAEGRGSTLPS